MFEIGKHYTIITWEGTEDGGMETEHPGCEVLEVQMPVVKVNQNGSIWIVNMSSPGIGGAKLET